MSISQLPSPIVVTGASGFVGANLCRYLRARGARVVAISGPSGRPWRLEGVDVEIAPLDLRSREAIEKFVLQYEPSAILNCAAFGAYSSQTDADKIYQVNFEAVRHLLEAVRKLPRFRAFIQAGSSSEYGLNCTAPDEDAPTIPDSDYAVSKVAATAAVRYYAAKHGLPAWTFRLYSVYGALEESSRLIPKLLLLAQDGKYPPLVNPSISRDFVYIDDICRAFELAIEKAELLPKGEIFNIGSGHKTTLADLVSTVRQVFQIEAEPAWGSMPNRHWDHADWYANPAKALKLMDWRTATSLEDGLKLTWNWMKENPTLVENAIKNTIIPTTPTIR